MRVVLWLALSLGCRSAPPIEQAPRCPPQSARERAVALQKSILRGEIDRCAVSESAVADVEIRDALVETDERAKTSYTGHAALSAGLRRLKTISSDGPLRCAGDCCDVVRAGMTPGPLYLRRMCFAYGGQVSLITFVEVR